MQRLPPIKQHSVADEFKPRSELEIRIGKHFPELGGGDEFCGLDFIGVRMNGDRGLNNEDVVD